MQLTFCGTTASIPDRNEDSPCFLLNRELLFDCGWNVSSCLTPDDLSHLRCLVFTHLHHDHYLGLAQLLFYLLHSRALPLNELTIAGPKQDTARVVDLACAYLQLDRFYPAAPRPRVVQLEPGDTLQTPSFFIEVSTAFHPVPALSYRVREEATGALLGTTGDTIYDPSLAVFLRGCDALIHDATLGSMQSETHPAGAAFGHSTLWEAVKTAEDAQIPLLFPVHMGRAQAAEAAQIVQKTTTVKIQPPEKGAAYSIGETL